MRVETAEGLVELTYPPHLWMQWNSTEKKIPQKFSTEFSTENSPKWFDFLHIYFDVGKILSITCACSLWKHLIFAIIYLHQIHGVPLSRLDKFALSLRSFTCAPDQTHKKGALSQSACPIEKLMETLLFVLCYLNKTCSFHF